MKPWLGILGALLWPALLPADELILKSPHRVPQENKVAIPEDAAQKEAEKTIRDVFKEDYAVKTTPAQQKLAKKLLQQGMETKDDATLRYVLFREAVTLASRSGDLETLLRSLEEICNLFAVDTLTLKESTLTKAEPAIAKPEDMRKLVEALFKVTRDAVAIDQFETATRSAQTALIAAKRAKEITLTVQGDALVKSVAEAKSSFEKAKSAESVLAANPEDPNANVIWGEYLCINKGRWDKGLPLLAKGPDSPLKSLAVKELASAPETAVQLEMADAWWALAEKEKNSIRKSHLVIHSQPFYEKALPGATGLVKMKIEKRLAEIGAAGFTVQPKARDSVSQEGLVGWWKLDEGSGDSTEDSSGHNHRGSLSGGVEWAEGRLGKGLHMAGKSEMVTIADAPDLRLTGDMTIAIWFRRDTQNEDWIRLVGKGSHLARNYGIWLGSRSQNNADQKQIVFQQFGEGRLDVVNVSSGTKIPMGVWTHVAAVLKGQQATLYVNGQKAATGGRSAAPVTSSDPLTIGNSGFHQSMEGALDDVRLYSRALTDSEIETIAKQK